MKDRIQANKVLVAAIILTVLAMAAAIGGIDFVRSRTLSISVMPATIMQGDPVLIIINATTTAQNIASAEVAATSSASDSNLHFFPYHGGIAALYGVDLGQATGTATVTIRFKGGQELQAYFIIQQRKKPTEFLAIPEQVGGNSAANQAAVVSTLASENYQLARIKSHSDDTYWTDAFAFPVASTANDPIVVTNGYGYIRESGATTIIHKGTDFRAPVGTAVYAINAGVVRQAIMYEEYGDTVVIDHGDGILSLYMHLSNMNVKEGQAVHKGDLIGLSGETGYSEGPHLHLSIRVGGVSIDPMRFFGLMGSD